MFKTCDRRVSCLQGKEKSALQLALLAFFSSQLILVLNEYIPYSDYLLTMLLFPFALISFPKMSIKAIWLSLSVFFLMYLGILFSAVHRIGNDNIFLAAAFALNCIIYGNFAYTRAGFLRKEGLFFLFDAALVFIIVACVYNLAVNTQNILTLNLKQDSYGVSFSSFYTNRNTFAALLLLSLGISLYMFLSKRKKRYFLGFLFIGLNLLFTFSRSSVLSAGIFLFVFLALQTSGNAKKKLIFFVFILFSALLVYILLNRYQDYITHYLVRKDYGDTYRFQYWKLALQYFPKSPLFGFGPGVAEQMLEKLGKVASTSFHNTYIEIAMWGGSLLLLFYLLICRDIVRAIVKIKAGDILFYRIYTALLLAFAVRGLFETTMFFAMGGLANTVTLLLFSLPILYSKTIKRSAPYA